MFVNFFLTPVSLNERPLSSPGFHEIWCLDYWCWKSKVNQYALPSFNSLLNDREFCVTSEFFRVPGKCVMLLRPPQKAEVLLPSTIIL